MHVQGCSMHGYLTSYPVDTGRKLNVHKTFRRRPGRLLNVLCTFNSRPVSAGYLASLSALTQTHSPSPILLKVCRHFKEGQNQLFLGNSFFSNTDIHKFLYL